MLNGKKLIVVMPAYNAARTLRQTYSELPMDFVDEVILVDDGSSDPTVTLSKELGLVTFLHKENFGYGRNQKTCYREALKRGADIVVMLHPDYQYSPKLILSLAGMVAGAMTRSGVVGTVGGTEIPPVRESFDAFANGVHAMAPKARILRAFVGNWDDVSAGKEQATAQINQGADVIFQNADAAGLGVFQAARETKRALVIGSNSNQNSVAPEITLGSVVIDLPHAFLTIARSVADKSFRPEPISLGTSAQVVMLVVNPSMASRIPQGVRARVDSLQKEMFAGRYHAPAAASH